MNDNRDGWIKLYRKSMDSKVWQNNGLWKLWCYCLYQASPDNDRITVRVGWRSTTEVRLKPGQFVFSRFSAAEALQATPSGTYKRLQKLKSMGNIKTESHGRYTLVTVCNWRKYQKAN